MPPTSINDTTMLTVCTMVNTNPPSPSTNKSHPRNSLPPTKMASDQYSLFNDRIITQPALPYQAQSNVIPPQKNAAENPIFGLLLLSEAAMQHAKDSNKTQDSSGTNKVKAQKIVRKTKPAKKAKRLPLNSTASNPKETKDDVCNFIINTDTNQACGKQFSGKDKLIAHMKIHNKIKPYICDVCSKKFENKYSRNKHQKEHNTGKKHTCTICNKNFMKSFILKQHMDTHSSKKPFSCDLCSKRFLRKHTLKEHKLAHSKNKHSCYICKETFIKGTDIIKHMATMHDNKKAFSCNLCGKLFRKFFYLTTHKHKHKHTHTHTHTQNKLHLCKVCNKQFPSPSQLQQHDRTHTKDKPFTCNICKIAFAQKFTLKRHMYIHTPREKPFACGICKKTFTQKYRLTKHLCNHTAEEQPIPATSVKELSPQLLPT